MRDTTPLGPGREFDLVRELLTRWGPRASGVGDDASVLDVPHGEQLVVSTDSSVEHVHFRRDWLSAREIGYRATAAALSDLAAMAAAPLGLLAAITVPDSWRGELASIAEGIGQAAELAGTRILGGDLSAGAELSLTITALGSAVEPVRRGGAAEGDRICVTGTLGGPAAAIAALRGGRRPDDVQRERFAHPAPRIREARWLADRGATAAIDISDGLIADARHLAAASGVRILIDLDRVPRIAGIDARTAAASGEEYELLVAISPSAAIHDFERSFRLALTEIGQVAGRGDAGVDVVSGGASVAPPEGYDHFSS